MSITFYLLLTYLNLTKQRKKFDWKRLETKMNVFFGIYSVLWLLVCLLAIFMFFVSIIVFIPLVIILVWMIMELITDRAILIYGKNKEILQKEFMSVNEESVQQAIKEGKYNKHHK